MCDSPIPRRVALGAAILVGLSGIAPLAFAEGGFNSSLTSVRIGFGSRNWYDGNSDAVQTSVSHYTKCQSGPTSVTYTLYRVRGALPDVNMGAKSISCASTGTAYYGDVVSSNYHVTVTGIASASSVSVADWRVKF